MADRFYCYFNQHENIKIRYAKVDVFSIWT